MKTVYLEKAGYKYYVGFLNLDKEHVVAIKVFEEYQKALDFVVSLTNGFQTMKINSIQ